MTVYDYDNEIKIRVIGHDFETNKKIEKAFIYQVRKHLYNLRNQLRNTNYSIKTVTDYKPHKYRYMGYYLDVCITTVFYRSTLANVKVQFELYMERDVKNNIHSDLQVNNFIITIYPPNVERRLKIKQLGLI
jgi:hypothetical protein